MKYIVYILCSIMLISGNAYAAGTKRPAAKNIKTYAAFWKKLNEEQRFVMLIGMRDGMQAFCLLGSYNKDILNYVNGDQTLCIMKKFDEMYGKNINIDLKSLFGFSYGKCRGEITEEKFISLVEKYKEK